MTDFLTKLSSYNFFNYLLPGVLFAAIVSSTTPFHLLQNDLLVGLFLYYFIGLVISRFGSLVIEPLLRRTSFVSFVDYAKFIVAEKQDAKIELLSEANNMYRTLAALFILLLLTKVYALLGQRVRWLGASAPYVTVSLLAVLFLWSYRKQTSYVVKRVESSGKQSV